MQARIHSKELATQNGYPQPKEGLKKKGWRRVKHKRKKKNNNVLQGGIELQLAACNPSSRIKRAISSPQPLT